MSMILALALAAQPQPQEPQQQAFEAAVGAFAECLRATVQMGMTTRMAPAEFQAGLARACLAEEARFREEAVRFATSQGWTEERARAEIETNVANSRRAFAADQESYVRTGRVPR
jgi:hypothetical protein